MGPHGCRGAGGGGGRDRGRVGLPAKVVRECRSRTVDVAFYGGYPLAWLGG